MQISRPKLVGMAVWGFVSLAILIGALGSVFAYHYFNLTSPSNPSSISYLTSAIVEVRALDTDVRLLGPADITGSEEAQEIRTLIAGLDNVASKFQGDEQTQADFKVARQLLANLISLTRPGQQAATPQSTAPVLAVLDRILNNAHLKLLDRVSARNSSVRMLVFRMCALGTALFILALLTSILVRLELHRSEKGEQSILLEKQQLDRHINDLGLVSICSEFIHAATNQEEILDGVVQVLCKLMPQSAGFIALIDEAGDTAEICSSWGDRGPLFAPFPPRDCFSVQLNRLDHHSQSISKLNCRHALGGDVDWICSPIRGHGGAVGILHVGASTIIPAENTRIVSLIGSHLGFGLANLRLREAFKEQSIRDGLTGLFNRRYFDETLHRELASSLRREKSLCLLMLDIDHFKRLNDTHGHAAGDEALRALGQLIRSSFRAGDILCRYGGEEFALVLPDTELSDGLSKAEHLRQLVQETKVGHGSQVIVNFTVSIGVASSLEFKTTESLMKAADSALYEAKQSGRNTTRVCSSATPSLLAGTMSFNSP
jgi:diguanylate cyclase (GGDEF)-like protein